MGDASIQGSDDAVDMVEREKEVGEGTPYIIRLGWALLFCSLIFLLVSDPHPLRSCTRFTGLGEGWLCVCGRETEKQRRDRMEPGFFLVFFYLSFRYWFREMGCRRRIVAFLVSMQNKYGTASRVSLSLALPGRPDSLFYLSAHTWQNVEMTECKAHVCWWWPGFFLFSFFLYRKIMACRPRGSLSLVGRGGGGAEAGERGRE